MQRINCRVHLTDPWIPVPYCKNDHSTMEVGSHHHLLYIPQNICGSVKHDPITYDGTYIQDCHQWSWQFSEETTVLYQRVESNWYEHTLITHTCHYLHLQLMSEQSHLSAKTVPVSDTTAVTSSELMMGWKSLGYSVCQRDRKGCCMCGESGVDSVKQFLVKGFWTDPEHQTEVPEGGGSDVFW
eukprot:681697-Ditylum_brightwellii.AAC.1